MGKLVVQHGEPPTSWPALVVGAVDFGVTRLLDSFFRCLGFTEVFKVTALGTA